MRKILISVAIVLFAAGSGLAQGTCARHTEAAGGFSYCPPAGWISKDSSSGGYKTFLTPTGSAAPANMNVKEEASSLSHNDYVAAALKLILEGNPDKGAEMMKIVGWSDFTTASNWRGSRLIYERLYKGTPLRTVQYVFDAPGKKLIFTGTAREADKEATDTLFDAAMKTLRLGR